MTISRTCRLGIPLTRSFRLMVSAQTWARSSSSVSSASGTRRPAPAACATAVTGPRVCSICCSAKRRSAALAMSTSSTLTRTPADLSRSRPASSSGATPGPARPIMATAEPEHASTWARASPAAPELRLTSTTSDGTSGNSPEPGVAAGIMTAWCGSPAASITSSVNSPGSAVANRRAARSPPALSGTRSTVIPSSGCSACRLAQNPVKPGPCVITTSRPLLIASRVAASSTAQESALAESPTIASARSAAGSWRKSS